MNLKRACSSHTQACGAGGLEYLLNRGCLLAFMASLMWAPPALGQSPETPIALRFQSIEIRAALQILAEYGGTNLIVSDAVAGEITLELHDTHWREAFDLILLSEGLQAREEGRTVIVSPLGKSEHQRLVTQVFQLRFAEAEPVKGLLNLRGDASCLVDQRTNTLVLTDTPAALLEHASLVERIDVPVGQVLIEARVLIASAQASEQLGVTWLGSAQKAVGEDGAIEIGRAPSSTESSSSEPAPLVDLGVNIPGASRFGVGFVGRSGMLDVEISALETSGEAEIIAKPRVVTTNRQTAVVRSGVQIPYQESTSSGATSTSFQSATLSLEVTPRIASDEQVVLVLKVNQDTVGRTYSGVPSINTNAIETQVLVESGETLVLGGVYQNDVNKSVSRTPVLGRIPLLGRLFRRTISSDDRRELLVFLTPEVLPSL